jgi:hypothetical protein
MPSILVLKRGAVTSLLLKCGMERNEIQLKSLPGSAGFRVLRVLMAEVGPYWIIEADMIENE